MILCSGSFSRTWALFTKFSAARIFTTDSMSLLWFTITCVCPARYALRILVNASAIGSLTLIHSSILPAGSGHSGDLARGGVFAETKAAHAKITHVGAGSSADHAAVIFSNLELRCSLLFQYKGFLCHLYSLLVALEWHAKLFEELAALVVAVGGGDDGYIQAADGIHFIIFDFRKHGLFLEAKGIVSPAVERIGRNAVEVAQAGDHDRDQPVQKFIHHFTAQGYLAADRHALAQLEVGYGFAGFGHDRLAAGDLFHVLHGIVQDSLVLGGASDTHAHHDFYQTWHLMRILVGKALLQGRDDCFLIMFFQTVHLRLSYSSSPDFLQTRTRVPARSTNTGLLTVLSFSLNSITLEACTGASLFTIPPCGFFCEGLVCFLIICTFSTMTRLVFGYAFRTRPLRPLSSPDITMTRSPFLSFSLSDIISPTTLPVPGTLSSYTGLRAVRGPRVRRYGFPWDRVFHR